MGQYHARLSPSSAHRWTSCTASVTAQEGVPNEGNEASRRGTACHLLLEEMLLDPMIEPQSYLGRWLDFHDGLGEHWRDTLGDRCDNRLIGSVEIDQEIIEIAHTAFNYVMERMRLTGAKLYVEQAVPISQFTGEEGATGRTDVTLVYGRTVETIDLKGGRGRVTAYDILVPAHEDIITNKPVPEKVRVNLQLACYALGTIEALGLFHEFDEVIMTIVQPALNHVSTYGCTIDELREVEEFLREKAEETRTNPKYTPSPDNCHFCRASGNCTAQAEMAVHMALDGFGDEAKPRAVSDMALGQVYAMLPLVTDWVDAIEGRVRTLLEAGTPVMRDDGLGYKLVAGKKGARQWADEAKAEAELLRMRVKRPLIYKQKLISPTDAEKLATPPKVKKGQEPLPPALGPTQWNKLQAHITQNNGRPTIVLETDPRPAVAPATEGFDDVPPADNSDLF